MQEKWKMKFGDLQKEKYALSIRLQELEVEHPRMRVAKGGEKVSLTEDELISLRQEILEQETLIKGYQLENEKAMKKLNKVQRDAKEKALMMAEENASLASQLANLLEQQKLIPGNPISPDGMNLRAELHNAHSNVDTLKLEVEKLIQLNKSLELKILNMDAKMVAMLKTEEKSMRDQGLTTEAILRKESEFKPSSEKVLNSVQLETSDEEFSSLKHKNNISMRTNQMHEFKAVKQGYETRIHSLMQQLQQQSGKMGDLSKREQVSTRKIKELEKQVEDVRSFYIKKVKELTRKLNNAEKENVIFDLKKGYSKTKAGDFQDLSMELKDLKYIRTQISTHEDAPSDEHMISKASQKKLNMHENGLGIKAKCESSDTPYLVESVANAKVVKQQRHHIQLRPSKISKTANQNLCVSLKRGHHSDHIRSLSNFEKCQLMKPATTSKQGSVKHHASFTAINLEELDVVKGGCDERQEQCKKEVESVACTNTQVVNVAEGHCHMHESNDEDTGLNCVSLNQTAKDTRKFKVLEKSTQNLEARVKDLSEKFDVSQARQNWSPGASQLTILRKKVEDMETYQIVKEQEWQALFEETKRVCIIEQDILERKWQLAMDVKNAEIERLQLELDAILEAAQSLQQTHQDV